MLRPILRTTAALLLAAWPALADVPAAIRCNEEGIAHLLAGRAEEATRAFEEALAAAPGDAVVERNLAAALAAWGEDLRRDRRPAEAIALLERATRLHPTRLRYRLLLGRVRFEGGDDALRAAAREDFAFVLERDPDHLDALVSLGQIAYLERDLPEAVARWRRALELRPDDADILARLAKAERELEVEREFMELPGNFFLVRYSPAIPVERAQEVLALCEEARGKLSVLYHSYPPRIVVTLYTPGEFQTATNLHGWVTGLSDGTIRLTIGRHQDPAALRATVYHELTHHVIREIAPGAPVWLHEGLAQIEEGKSAAQAEARLRLVDPLPESLLSAEVLRQSDPRKVALFYDVALSFTRFLQESQGGAIPRFLQGIAARKAEADAFRDAFGESRGVLFERWRAHLGTR